MGGMSAIGNSVGIGFCAGILKQFDLAKVIAGSNDFPARIPVDCVDIGAIRTRRPDALDRPPNDASPRSPHFVSILGGPARVLHPVVGLIVENLIGAVVQLEGPAVQRKINMQDSGGRTPAGLRLAV